MNSASVFIFKIVRTVHIALDPILDLFNFTWLVLPVEEPD